MCLKRRKKNGKQTTNRYTCMYCVHFTTIMHACMHACMLLLLCMYVRVHVYLCIHSCYIYNQRHHKVYEGTHILGWLTKNEEADSMRSNIDSINLKSNMVFDSINDALTYNIWTSIQCSHASFNLRCSFFCPKTS